MTFHWSEEDDDYLALAYVDGESSLRELADFMGCSLWAVSKRVHELKSMGVIEPKRLRGWSKEELTFLVKHYRSLSNRELADRLGKSEAAICNKVSKLRLDKKGRQIDLEELKRLADKGYSRKSIANKMGFHYRSICAVARKHGVKIVDSPNPFRKGHKELMRACLRSWS